MQVKFLNTREKNPKQVAKAEALLFEEMPVIPLFTQNLQYLMRDNIHLEITDLGIYDFKSFHLAKSHI